MPRAPLTLQPKDPDELPLAFSMGETLEGRRTPWHDERTGRRTAGRVLDTQLDAFGYGPKTITISGSIRPPDQEPGYLEEWAETVTVAGPLDSRSLGRVAHQLARRVVSRYGKGHTPPELYATEIMIAGEEPEPLPLFAEVEEEAEVSQYIYRERSVRFKGRKKVKQTIYRDRATGRFASKDAWQTSKKKRNR